MVFLNRITRFPFFYKISWYDFPSLPYTFPIALEHRLNPAFSFFHFFQVTLDEHNYGRCPNLQIFAGRYPFLPSFLWAYLKVGLSHLHVFSPVGKHGTGMGTCCLCSRSRRDCALSASMPGSAQEMLLADLAAWGNGQEIVVVPIQRPGQLGQPAKVFV